MMYVLPRAEADQDQPSADHMEQYGSDVHDNAIDMANLYEEPQVVYLWLRSAVEPTNAPAIAKSAASEISPLCSNRFSVDSGTPDFSAKACCVML